MIYRILPRGSMRLKMMGQEIIHEVEDTDLLNVISLTLEYVYFKGV